MLSWSISCRPAHPGWEVCWSFLNLWPVSEPYNSIQITTWDDTILYSKTVSPSDLFIFSKELHQLEHLNFSFLFNFLIIWFDLIFADWLLCWLACVLRYPASLQPGISWGIYPFGIFWLSFHPQYSVMALIHPWNYLVCSLLRLLLARIYDGMLHGTWHHLALSG